jgi:tetratricopeptide (TPR) repeat protein
MPFYLFSDTPVPESEKDKYIKAGIYFLTNEQPDQALAAAAHLIEKYPNEEMGYLIATEAFWRKKKFDLIVYTVNDAKSNDVESIALYKIQGKALYALGSLITAMHSLNQIEKTLNKSQASQT